MKREALLRKLLHGDSDLDRLWFEAYASDLSQACRQRLGAAQACQADGDGTYSPKAIQLRAVGIDAHFSRCDRNPIRELETDFGLDRKVGLDSDLPVAKLGISDADGARLEAEQAGGRGQMLQNARLKDAPRNGQLFAAHFAGQRTDVYLERREGARPEVVEQHRPFVPHLSHNLRRTVSCGHHVGRDVLVSHRQSDVDLIIILQGLQKPEAERSQDEAHKDKHIAPSYAPEEGFDPRGFGR